MQRNSKQRHQTVMSETSREVIRQTPRRKTKCSQRDYFILPEVSSSWCDALLSKYRNTLISVWLTLGEVSNKLINNISIQDETHQPKTQTSASNKDWENDSSINVDAEPF